MTNQDEHEVEQLSENVERLTAEVRVLRDCLDELKTSIEWATRNARLIVRFEKAAKHRLEPPPPIELIEVGNGVTWEQDGETLFGEITELDDGGNTALVQLIPSTDLIPVRQDELTRHYDDPLSLRADSSRSTDQPLQRGNHPPPSPGQLF